MPERQQPDRDPGSAPHIAESDTPKIETPVIQIQDLEHQPGADTRVNTKGMKINPPSGALPRLEIDTLEHEDEKAREAIAELEEQYKKLPPG
jgi:predicted component of type VI protein secretion system